jgi:Protein of unknown function (DUF3489)
MADLFCRIALLVSATRAMNVIDTASGGKESTYMKTFTIDADNNVTVHGSKKAAKETGLPSFASAEEFAEIIGTDNHRLVEIFNSLSGVKPVTKFANRKAGAERIWRAIQKLGESAPTSAEREIAVDPVESLPVAASEQPEITETAIAESDAQLAAPPEAVPAETLAETGAQAADVAPEQTVATNVTTAVKKARKSKNAAKTEADADAKPEATGPREGSKMAQVIAMLQREQGATISEIMSSMGWQRHTVRGFMAGAMKKAGYAVESFKPEGGERTYRIQK